MADKGSPTRRLALGEGGYLTPGSEGQTDRDAWVRARSVIKCLEVERKEEVERQTRKEESDRQERQAEPKLKAETGTPTQTSAPTFVTDRTRLPTFDDDKDELDDFLRQFERIASDQQWEEGTRASRLSTCLKGRALQLYNSLEDDEVRDHRALKKALLQRFNLTAEAYRRRLRNSKRLSDELSN
ncbi:microfibrillar-associated protein 1-like [Littorina saxatilis]|uniref:microfibrillar-associated protein 1-like n=1 Tax=Littorina saxatilis TaxID=31220 RepID=UPI0038B5A6F2